MWQGGVGEINRERREVYIEKRRQKEEEERKDHDPRVDSQLRAKPGRLPEALGPPATPGFRLLQRLGS